MLNEWVIRRPVVHGAPTGRGPHREGTVVDIHWHSVVLLCKNTVLFLENELTITLDCSVGLRLV